jgi:hypothetical protein
MASWLESLPPEALQRIALQLEYHSLVALCQASSHVNRAICQDKSFWIARVFSDIDMRRKVNDLLRLSDKELQDSLLGEDYTTIIQLCLANARITKQVCRNESFWKTKYMREYPGIPKPNYISYRNAIELLEYLNSSKVYTMPPIGNDITKIFTTYRIKIRGRHVVSLPAAIGSLSNLRNLEITLTNIEFLPANIGQLYNLQRLDLSKNKLVELPREIGKLGKLNELNVGDNNLRSIPPEIGNLTELKSLYLYDNSLTSLPNEIGRLKQLQQLELGGNPLDRLPYSIGQLRKLVSLSVSECNLQELPDSIGQLLQVSELDIGDNDLVTLPPSMTRMLSLSILCLPGNPVAENPDETLEILLKSNINVYTNDCPI